MHFFAVCVFVFHKSFLSGSFGGIVFTVSLHQGHQGEGEALPSTAPCVLPPGSIIYTLLPDGEPVPQGTVLYGLQPLSAQASGGGPVAPTTVVYGSPPAGIQLHYGFLPANYSVPLVPLGILHCNIPDHRNLVRDQIIRFCSDKRRNPLNLGLCCG